ncbi:MAG: hypothetical protein KIH63_004775 [Candidatus Saccharibacteria bacterium]|nr:hypothetical protein [Candidatus Saccharibacteria bacterium]
MNDGLQFLNEILADKAIEKDMIPYFQKYTFNAIAGQEQYFIPNLEDLETLVFFINDVRYQMRPINRKVYFGSSRANNINSLPFNWHIERCTGGANLFLYFFPQTNYELEAWGTFRLSSVALNQNLLSSVTKVNLGRVFAATAGTLAAGELVINDVDLAGAYGVTQTAANLATVINTDVPNVTATVVLNELILTNTRGSNIIIETLGTQSTTDYVTFYNFSTQNGPIAQTFLPLVLDQFYINYLKFSLAERLCTEFNFIVPPGVAKQLLQYQNWIAKRSAPMDLSQTKISTFANGATISYSQVNLGLGWTIG